MYSFQSRVIISITSLPGFCFCQILASRTISSANAWGVLYPLIAISPEHSGMGTISSMKSKVSCSMLKQFKLSVFVG